jgi:hypothetical protein
MHTEHALGLLVRRALANLTPQFDAPGPSRRKAALDPIPDQIALELGQSGHDGAHELPARCAQIEAEARLSQDADFPAVQIVQRLDEILPAVTSYAQKNDWSATTPDRAGLLRGGAIRSVWLLAVRRWQRRPKRNLAAKRAVDVLAK